MVKLILLGDQIYGTRKNRELLKEKGIRFGGKPLGRPKKQTQENKKAIKKSKQQQKEDHRNRIPIEGKFGQGKQGYRLNNILARTAKTSESWVRNIFFVMNLLVLAKVFIWLELNSCIDVLIEKIIHLLNIKDRPEYVDASYPQLRSSRGRLSEDTLYNNMDDSNSETRGYFPPIVFFSAFVEHPW